MGLGMQILEIITQRWFISAICHAHSYAQKPHKANLIEMYGSRQYLSIDHSHSNAHKRPTRKNNDARARQ